MSLHGYALHNVRPQPSFFSCSDDFAIGVSDKQTESRRILLDYRRRQSIHFPSTDTTDVSVNTVASWTA